MAVSSLCMCLGVGLGGGEGKRVCVSWGRGCWKEKCCREHHLAKDKERKPKNEMGTEWKKMGGQCGKAGGNGGEQGGNETVMVVDRLEFTTGSW